MLCPGAEDEFHIYGIEWTGQKITTYVDGKKQLEYANRGLGRDDWPYDDPFYVILNLAWGGDWGGSQGVDESQLPVEMMVDYVRVYQKDAEHQETGIHSAAKTTHVMDGYMFDLQGRRISRQMRGIYIQNGQKYYANAR
jgi:beta-glucanase (GH16 family)